MSSVAVRTRIAAVPSARGRFEAQVVAFDLRPAQIRVQAPVVADRELGVEADGIDLGLAVVVVVLDDHERHVVERARLHAAVLDRARVLEGRAVAQMVPYSMRWMVCNSVEVGVVGIEQHVQAVVRPVLDDAHERLALVERRLHAALVAADDRLAAPIGESGVTPGLLVCAWYGRLVVRDTERHADRVVRELVDVGEVDAIAGVVRPGMLASCSFISRLYLYASLRCVVRQRMHGRDVGGARDALVRHAGIGSLVDLDLRHQLRRVLVELDRAVVVGGRLLAAVEGGDREVRAEPRIDSVCARPLVRCAAMPGRRAMDSAIEESGSLPMSSAETTSTMESPS